MICSVIADQTILWVAVKDKACFSIVLIIGSKKYFVRLVPSIKDKKYYKQYFQGKYLQMLSSQRIANIVKKLNQMEEQQQQQIIVCNSYHCDQWGNVVSFD